MDCFLASVSLNRDALKGAEFEKKKVRFGLGQVTGRKFTNHRTRNNVAMILMLPQI